jgi:cardiolipin synthase
MNLMPPEARRDAAARPATELRLAAEGMLSRAAGAALIGGNAVRLLRDAAENYPAWLGAIAAARRSVLFENYMIADDAVGRLFVEALAERARAGVNVRVIHDWMGGLGTGSARLLAPLVASGAQVRCFNPPRIDSPFGWLTRDHRKMLAVDGETGYVSGLCVERRWAGDPSRAVAPWRDTGIEIRGPAVADIVRAFAQTWTACGGPALEVEPLPAAAGTVELRVLAAQPSLAGLYRMDQMIAALARESLWLTDAYFVGIPTYVEALRAAARDGVDVRLLVPGASDLPLVGRFSRAGYRPLLEAGIRVFEWNGTMLHAKTAVADGRWSRVGSSNLNLASWIGNYELDIALDDIQAGAQMQSMYLDDLGNATEIVLGHRHRIRRTPGATRRRSGGGGAARAAAGALRIGNTVGAAFASRRILGPAEAGMLGSGALAFLLFALLALLAPLAVTVPLALLSAWIGLTLLVRAWRMRRGREDTASGQSGG